jgi:hypothetical protein
VLKQLANIIGKSDTRTFAGLASYRGRGTFGAAIVSVMTPAWAATSDAPMHRRAKETATTTGSWRFTPSRLSVEDFRFLATSQSRSGSCLLRWNMGAVPSPVNRETATAQAQGARKSAAAVS